MEKGTMFATDYYIFRHYTSSQNFLLTYHYRWDTNVVNDYGVLLEIVRLLRISLEAAGTGSNSVVDHVSPLKFFSVIPYRGVIDQGPLNSSPFYRESSTANMISGMDYAYMLPYAEAITLTVEEVEGATYQWFVDKCDDKGFVNIDGATTATYILPTLEASMNGRMYRCAVIEKEVSELGEGYTISDPVTLTLIGEDIPTPTTEMW